MNRSELYKKAISLPLLPGVYIMKDEGGEIIYIGKAKRLKVRVSGYFRASARHEDKVERMVEAAYNFDVIVTDSEFEALVLECSLIKLHKPKYNILLKDDKGYSYIKVTNERFARITVEFRRENDGARYIGPYTSSYTIKQLVEEASLAFKLPECRKRFPEEFKKGRPCLNAHIGRCMALCEGKIGEREYAACIEGALEMIEHGGAGLVKKLKNDMMAASETMDYERAARIRDRIAAIERSFVSQKVVASPDKKDMDVFGFAAANNTVCAETLKFRGGRLVDGDERVIKEFSAAEGVREEYVTNYYLDKRELPAVIALDADFESSRQLERLLSERAGRAVKIYVPQKGDIKALVDMAYKNAAERLFRESGKRSREQTVIGELAALIGLTEAPERIESYDISNLADEIAVAGMVVFEHGKPKRSEYRRFKIKDFSGVDDYAAMAQTLTRRVREYDSGATAFSKRPDLILLDGGTGHVNAVAQALAGTSFADIPLIGMVKDQKHTTRGLAGKEGTIELSPHRNVFTFVSTVQNETHRFAIEYQRSLHKKKIGVSLTKINGVGEATARALMEHFKTIKALSEASVEEISCIRGVSKALAEKIYDNFH